MPNGTLEFDPFTGQGLLTRLDGSQEETNVSEFTAGRLYVSNGFLIDKIDPLNTISLGRQGNASLTALEHDRYSLISQTRAGSVNRTVGGDLLRMVSGTINVSLAGGDVQEYTIDPIPVAGVGAQWVVHQPPPDPVTGEIFPAEYLTRQGPFANTREVQQALGSDWRLATPEEAAYSSIFKQVLNDNSELLQKIIEEEGLETDSKGTAEYKAAAIVMQSLDPLSIKSYSSYLVE